ncbi:transport and Golgi organization 2 homolog [Momordica charantia]|uniref:Transport and Golgi organization 2 homolog n=1 Tax=Momordica charantia TaxID=3673 RepID=A0A6J1DFX0_MOMCH|nr:transport and Golgi organization 2 homolog [Momordica charantia]XP_022153123.1 transport and Golgi organization 2 homolog [Momordica charantia]XP_022153124.1 transport and Golgi organization 2 homolog [Momordica charantia]XP_022153125.1 transport and Golgi organization 2 homolog [Momordica charantia]XP_022153126.1 transport and Golgi organization 2 homolog [Momordica charantia]
MCIAAFLWQSHPLYSLILLHNRDELLNRPTRPASWWEDGEIAGGRDEVAGGTWLACSRKGRVSFVTNVLELHTLPEAKSRGNLPLLFLQSRKSPKEFAEEIRAEAYQYNGFNLVVADISSNTMVYISNRSEGDRIVIQEVPPGLHVLSNAELDSPWHKAQRLRLKFNEQLHKCDGGEIPVKEMIERLMRDTVKADESKLPHICSLDWELDLSPIFVQIQTSQFFNIRGSFGTRSTTVLTISATGNVKFYETYLDNDTWKEKTLSYRIEQWN